MIGKARRLMKAIKTGQASSRGVRARKPTCACVSKDLIRADIEEMKLIARSLTVHGHIIRLRARPGQVLQPYRCDFMTVMWLPVLPTSHVTSDKSITVTTGSAWNVPEQYEPRSVPFRSVGWRMLYMKFRILALTPSEFCRFCPDDATRWRRCINFRCMQSRLGLISASKETSLVLKSANDSQRQAGLAWM